MRLSSLPPAAELLPFLMLVLQLSLLSAVLRAKRLRVGDRCTAQRCTALRHGMLWRGVAWHGMGGCGVGPGAAAVSPSSCGSTEVCEGLKELTYVNVSSIVANSGAVSMASRDRSKKSGGMDAGGVPEGAQARVLTDPAW